jgi:hypothetical protein
MGAVPGCQYSLSIAIGVLRRVTKAVENGPVGGPPGFKGGSRAREKR